MTQPALIKVKSQDRDRNVTHVEITITEGRNRQVRRMFSHFGHEVTKLSRVEYGPLNLKGLNAGQGRTLTPHEVKVLRHLAQDEKLAENIHNYATKLVFSHDILNKTP